MIKYWNFIPVKVQGVWCESKREAARKIQDILRKTIGYSYGSSGIEKELQNLTRGFTGKIRGVSVEIK